MYEDAHVACSTQKLYSLSILGNGKDMDNMDKAKKAKKKNINEVTTISPSENYPLCNWCNIPEVVLSYCRPSHLQALGTRLAQKFSNFPLRPSKVELKTYTGKPLTVRGDVVHKGHEYTMPIIVAIYEKKSTLLGKK